MLRRGVHADTGSWNERARYTSGFVYRVYSSECSLILLCDLSSVFYADPCHSTRCFLYAFTRESDINFLSGFDSIFDVFIPTGTSLFKVTRCILDYKPNAFITIEPFNSYKTVFFFSFFFKDQFHSYRDVLVENALLPKPFRSTLFVQYCFVIRYILTETISWFRPIMNIQIE